MKTRTPFTPDNHHGDLTMATPPDRPPSPMEFSEPEVSNRQLLILLGLFLGGVVFLLWALRWILGGLVMVIPPEVEQQLGRAIAPIYQAQAEPSPTQDRLNLLLDQLETHLPADHGGDYEVFYIPEPTVNAIAIPGNKIIIYEGLLAAMESENELMMVLGHELGHFQNRDHLRSLGRGILVRLVLGSVFGDGGTLAAIALDGAQVISSAQYSQGQETAADEVGLELLQQHYGHVAGATDFFRTLEAQDNGAIAFLSTHPAPEKRVQHLNQLILQKAYPQQQKTPLPPELQRDDHQGQG